jgi:hypothetical protein
MCSDVNIGLSRSLPLAVRALRIMLNFSQKVGALQQAGSHVCATVKGARADIDRAVLHAVAVAAMPPPILLLGRAHLVESPRQGTVEINWPLLLKFSAVFLCDELCSFGV